MLTVEMYIDGLCTKIQSLINKELEEIKQNKHCAVDSGDNAELKELIKDEEVIKVAGELVIDNMRDLAKSK